MDNNLSTDKQLVSSIRNTEWIDLSSGHKNLRNSIEEQINSACVGKNDTSPIMVKGAFGIGKTATLHYMFHYAWTKLGVPAFLLNLEDIIIEIKKHLAENDSEKLPNKDVSKVIGNLLSEQIDVLKTIDSNSIEAQQIYFPSFDQGNLSEYLAKFKQARLHTNNNGGYKDEELPLFDLQKIIDGINSPNRCLLLIDEFEAKYQELKDIIESSGGGMLRHFFDDVASISSTNYYCIIGNGPASGYELNKDLKEKSDSNAAEQRRLFVKQLQMPTVTSLSKTFLKGYPKEHINFIWWLSRSRPGQIKKLKDNLQPFIELKEHSFDAFVRENIVFKDPIDDTGEANVIFLKSEIFNDYESPLQFQIKESLIYLGPRFVEINDENSKNVLLDGKELFSVSKDKIEYELLKDAIKKDLKKEVEYEFVDAEKISHYLDLILESISDIDKKICFGFLDKSNTDKALVDTFLHPLWSILYDMITIYEDENDSSVKKILDFLLIQNKIADDYENIDRTFKNVYDLFDINQQREDSIYIQLNLKTIREAIEQPIGSPSLPYKTESLEIKMADVDTIDGIFIWNKNKEEEIIVIPNYENEELLYSYIKKLEEYFTENWNDKKNYFANGELITNVVYLEENDKINEFKEWLCFSEENEELPYKLKRLDVKHIDLYQIHNSQRISDFISSLTKIATVGLFVEEIEGKNLKKFSDSKDDNIIRMDKIVDIILDASWTESKQTRRTIEYYKDLLSIGENSVLNQISLVAKKAYNLEIEKYVSDIEKIKEYSYSIKLNDKDHLETVFSSPSRRFISYSLAQNEKLDEKLVEILDNIQDLKLYPTDDKENLSIIGYNGFVKKHKKDLQRFIDDFHQSDKLTKGIKKYLEVFSEYSGVNKVKEINVLLSEENLLHKSYLKYVGISTYANYFFDGLFLNILSDRIEDSEVFKTTLLSELDSRKSELRELSTELLDISENLKDLTGKKDDFIVVNDIDNFYTKAIIPFTLYLEQNFSISNLIIGKYIETTIDRKIKTVKEFISNAKKLESSLQFYKSKIQVKQNTINALYAGDSLNIKLFKEKYSTPRNGNYLYSRLFVESFKKIGGGDSYDKIFQQKYKPAESFWINNDDVSAFQSTLKLSYENNTSGMDEIIENLQSISEDVENMRSLESSILNLIKIEDNE
ncbi:hypothetical protein [uncultured Lutibacter sp.]|uniref:hypothetical protein n=1 Tax=uncultured Lutibacter sp. TaxID=437739 RepID=UPI00260B198B|nr:hypothetical protein [uncultured Lutibacter sp.]